VAFPRRAQLLSDCGSPVISERRPSVVSELHAVLDTAPVVAVAAGSEQSFGPGARRLIQRASRTGTVPGIRTVWLFEVAQLEERGRLKLRPPFEKWCFQGAVTLHLELERPRVR
jgi:hypothetical protein